MNSRRCTLNWILLILWMVIIFYMSSQPGNISDLQSHGVLDFLKRLGLSINTDLDNMANFIVRKSAHFTEYMILAFLIFNVVINYYGFKKSLILSLIFVFIYASSDEFHQCFVFGRDGKFKDVIIDTLGGTTFLLIISIKRYILKDFNK